MKATVALKKPPVATKATVNVELMRIIWHNRGMARMLRVISDDEGIATADLIRKLKVSTHAYVLMHKAQEMGYLERRKETIQGKGSFKVTNHLTDKGRELVAVMKMIGI